MTGTGTSAEPYVPTTWSEFVTAIGTSGAYVSVPEGTEWDMNDIAPEGISSSISVTASYIYGNGLTVKNLFFKNDGRFLLTKTSRFYDIAFVDLLLESGSTFFYVDTTSAQYAYRCTFAGIVTDSIFCATNYTSNSSIEHMDLSQCAMKIEFKGNSALHYKASSSAYGYLSCEYCNIFTTGRSTLSKSTSYNDLALNNSLWRGTMPFDQILFYAHYLSSSSKKSCYNVFDIDISSDFTLPTPTSFSSNDVGNIINSDKINEGASVWSGITRVTDEQLHNADYLSSIGFPIVKVAKEAD